MIDIFIFDCFGVICEPVLNGWYRDHRLKKGFLDENLKKIFEKFDLGAWSENDMVDYFSSYEGVEATKEQIREQIDDYLKLDKALVNMIQALKDQGFKTVLLTNANASFFERKLYPTHPEFKTMFDEIIISSEIGMVKPYKPIYEYTLKKLHAKPEETLFIDDSESNVEGAIAVGMSGYVYTDRQSLRDYLRTLNIEV